MKTKLTSAFSLQPFLLALALCLTALPARAQTNNWGYALSFDGVDDYVRVPDAPALRLTNRFTLEFWFKPASLSQGQKYLLSHNDSVGNSQSAVIFGYSATNQVEFAAAGFSGDGPRPGSAITLPDTGWHHIAYSYDGTNWAGYLDGTPVFSTTRAFNLSPVPNDWFIGAANTTQNNVAGVFDEVRIWNVGRSAAQIQTSMLQPLTGTEPGLVAYYRFDEGTGTNAYDATSNHFDGSLVNVPKWVASIPTVTGWGSALSFDGINDYVQIADNNQLDLTANYTLECWFQPTVRDQWGGLVDKYQTSGANGYFLRFRDGNLEFDQMTTSDLNLQPGVWYHAAAVNNNGTRHLYVNGVEQTLSGSAVTVKTNNDPVCLGVDYGSRYFQGQMDEVCIWNVARSVGQIRADMLVPLTGTETGLVACYHLDEGTGNYATDATGNGHDGVLLNQPTRLASTVPVFTRWRWALSFDGNNDYVGVADSSQLDMAANYTLECWFNAGSFGGLRGLLSKYQTAGANGYLLRLNGNDLVFDEMTTSGLNLQAGVWYHVAAVNTNGTRHLYLNGQEVTLNGTAVNVVGNNNELRLGSDYGGRYFQGQMDEVCVWNMARSIGQIRADMLSPLAGTEAGLVACYHLDEGAGITTADATGNGHTGNVNQPIWLFSTVPSLDIPALWLAIVNASPGATITLTNTGTLALTGWEIPIEKDLTLVGPGAAKLAISGNNSSRVFNIASGVTVNISGLTIRDGLSANGANGSPGGAGANGGGICNAGSLTLSDCVVSNNATGNGGIGDAGNLHPGGAGGHGGGIYNGIGGVLALNRSSIRANFTGNGGNGGDGYNGSTGENGDSGGNGGNGGNGGGIYSDGLLVLNGCLLSGNQTGSAGTGGNGGNAGVNVLSGQNGGNGGNGGCGGFGGGIYGNGQMTLTNCTVSVNTGGSSALGGGCGTGTGGTLSSGHNGTAGTGAAGSSGGGIYNAGTLALNDCVVTNNHAGNGDNGQNGSDGSGDFDLDGFDGSGASNGGSGGGIYSVGTLALDSCHIDGNAAGDGGRGGSGGDGHWSSIGGGNGGNGANGGGGGFCGGIYGSGQVNMTNCTVSYNRAGAGGNAGGGGQPGGGFPKKGKPGADGLGGNGGSGGGIQIMSTGSLSMSSCTISLNAAGSAGGPTTSGTGAPGGGIYNAGFVTLSNCVLTNNRAGNGGTGATLAVVGGEWGTGTNGCTGGSGGGIYNAGTLIVSCCVVSQNSAGVGGGGGAVDYGSVSAPGASGGAGGSGGGIYNDNTLTISNCVLTENSTGCGGMGNQGSGNNGTNDWCYSSGSGGAGGNGGGIFQENSGALTMICSTVSGNFTADGGEGGPGPNGDSNALPDNNGGPGGPGGPGGRGGGIYGIGTVTLINCTLSGNYTGYGGVGASGGWGANGITGGYGANGGAGGDGGCGGGFCGGGVGTVTFISCTISGNHSGSGNSGGVGGAGGDGLLTTGDRGDGGAGGNGGSGGGIYCTKPMTLRSCTIAGNLAGTGGYPATWPIGNLGAGGNGSGTCSQGEASNLQVINSIIAQNGYPPGYVGSPVGSGPDAYGGFTSLGHNLVGNTNGSSGFGMNGDLLNVDALLGPLAQNGGPTLTCALLPWSPAINAGDATGAPATDQRGFPRIACGSVDIGAFEFQDCESVGIRGITSLTFQPGHGSVMSCIGPPGPGCVLQISTNLVDWLNLTNLVAGPDGCFQFTDSAATNCSTRFYRLRWP